MPNSMLKASLRALSDRPTCSHSLCGSVIHSFCSVVSSVVVCQLPFPQVVCSKFAGVDLATLRILLILLTVVRSIFAASARLLLRPATPGA